MQYHAASGRAMDNILAAKQNTPVNGMYILILAFFYSYNNSCLYAMPVNEIYILIRAFLYSYNNSCLYAMLAQDVTQN